MDADQSERSRYAQSPRGGSPLLGHPHRGLRGLPANNQVQPRRPSGQASYGKPHLIVSAKLTFRSQNFAGRGISLSICERPET